MEVQNNYSVTDKPREISAAKLADEKIRLLFDRDSFREMDAFVMADGTHTGVVTGFGTVDGCEVFCFVQDSGVDGGAVGRMHAAKMKKVFGLAAKTGTPVIGIYDSKGANIEQGNDTLAAIGDILHAINRLSGVVPQISIITGVCGGSMSMAACSADVVIMTKASKLYLSGSSDQSAENAAQTGVCQVLAEDDVQAIQAAKSLLSMLPANNLSAPPVAAIPAYVQGEPPVFDENSMLEFSRDFGKSAQCGLARIGGATVGYVRTVPHTALYADTCAKIARTVRFCDAFSIPVVTFVDTDGFDPGQADSVRQAARLSHVYAEATCPKISVVCGNAVAGAYIALAGRGVNADAVLALSEAVIAPLEIPAAAELIYQDRIHAGEPREALYEEYKRTLASPYQASADGYIDDVVSAQELRTALIDYLTVLAGKRESKLPKKHGNMPL